MQLACWCDSILGKKLCISSEIFSNCVEMMFSVRFCTSRCECCEMHVTVLLTTRIKMPLHLLLFLPLFSCGSTFKHFKQSIVPSVNACYQSYALFH